MPKYYNTEELLKKPWNLSRRETQKAASLIFRNFCQGKGHVTHQAFHPLNKDVPGRLRFAYTRAHTYIPTYTHTHTVHYDALVTLLGLHHPYWI